MKGHKITSADAVQAYLQSLLNSLAETWVRLPKEVWPDSWLDGMAARCSSAPSSGCFAAYMGTQMQELTGNASLNRNSLTWVQLEYQNSQSHTRFCHMVILHWWSMHVDDFLLSGDSGFHDAFCRECLRGS